jgi:hypothetical protein
VEFGLPREHLQKSRCRTHEIDKVKALKKSREGMGKRKIEREKVRMNIKRLQLDQESLAEFF